ncbi:MAG: hypothetical protein EA398_11330 [Deltaproteobacteria bacterium]|nr:MAG: hypothetical protein EA398_11330 [Deltaproteobacteria bacterium]
MDTQRDGFPAPPDGARLAALDARRRWLGDVEVAQSLPPSGMLWMPDPQQAWPQVVVEGPSGLWARADMDRGRRVSLPPAVREAVCALWPALWLAPAATSDAEGRLLLVHRGLFREVAGPPVAELAAILAPALRAGSAAGSGSG